MGLLNTMETILTVMEDHADLHAQLEPSMYLKLNLYKEFFKNLNFRFCINLDFFLCFLMFFYKSFFKALVFEVVVILFLKNPTL